MGAELRGERGLDFTVRIGVNTGEAVTGDATAGGLFTAGDIVNVAARLEQAAPARRDPAGARDVPARAPCRRGRAGRAAGGQGQVRAGRGPPPARRRPDARRAPRPRAPMVGRQRERRRLLDAFIRRSPTARASCSLCSAPRASASRGSSREVLETIDGAATVAAGRCLPYGDGLTWWPLVEALGESDLLEELAANTARAAARRGASAQAGRARRSPPDEAFWAVRRVLESLARRRPLVLVVDDLQWAEPTFIDLVEHVADWARDAPLLLLIMARPELLERVPAWGGGKPNATSVLLEPLARGRRGRAAGPPRRPGGHRRSAAARILARRRGQPAVRRGGRGHADRRRRRGGTGTRAAS